MNYIKQLERRIAQLEGQVEGLTIGLRSVRDYCLSDKFLGEGNNYVNPSDIVLRVDTTTNLGYEWADKYLEAWTSREYDKGQEKIRKLREESATLLGADKFSREVIDRLYEIDRELEKIRG